MTNPIHNKTVALIAGPTASGKTGLAIALANHNPDQKYIIINADSAQIYDHLPILSAQPDAEEMTQAEHRLFGYKYGSITCSAVSWANDAKSEIDKAHSENAIPILVGGTGMYIRTLLDGIAPIPDIDPDIRQSVRTMETHQAYEQLSALDAPMADILNPNDTTRIARALEVIMSTGTSIATWRKKKEGGIAEAINLKPLILLPPREWLYEKCDKRFVQMMDIGAIEEVEALIKRNPPADSPLWRAIGVKEISAYINGDIDKEKAIELGQIATRQYAKRQYTWFRNQAPSRWQRADGEINYKNINDFVTLFH